MPNQPCQSTEDKLSVHGQSTDNDTVPTAYNEEVTLPLLLKSHLSVLCVLCSIILSRGAMIEVTCNDRLGKKVRVKCKYPLMSHLTG